jgi:hypothetical protein
VFHDALVSAASLHVTRQRVCVPVDSCATRLSGFVLRCLLIFFICLLRNWPIEEGSVYCKSRRSREVNSGLMDPNKFMRQEPPTYRPECAFTKTGVIVSPDFRVLVDSVF